MLLSEHLLYNPSLYMLIVNTEKEHSAGLTIRRVALTESQPFSYTHLYTQKADETGACQGGGAIAPTLSPPSIAPTLSPSGKSLYYTGCSLNIVLFFRKF